MERAVIVSMTALTLYVLFRGAKGNRTPNLLLAKQVLCQLSYSPATPRGVAIRTSIPAGLVAPARIPGAQ